MTDEVRIWKKVTKWAWKQVTRSGLDGTADGFDTARAALDHWQKITNSTAIPIYIEREDG